MNEPTPQTLALLSFREQYERYGVTVWARDNGAYSIYRSRKPAPTALVGTYPDWATVHSAFIRTLRETKQ